MDLEAVKIKYAAPLPQKVPVGQALPGIVHPCGKVGRQFQPVMPGQDALHRKLPHLPDRARKRRGIGGGVKGIQTPGIEQVPRKQQAACFLIEAAVPGGVSRRMDDPHLPVAQVDHIAVFQQAVAAALIGTVIIRAKAAGKAQGRAVRFARTACGGSGK